MGSEKDVPTLFKHDGGRWLITTESSRYVMDLDTHTLTRTAGSTPEHHKADPLRLFGKSFDKHPSRSQLRKDEQSIPLLEMAPVVVGYPMEVLLDLVGNGVVTVRRSTNVVDISSLN